MVLERQANAPRTEQQHYASHDKGFTSGLDQAWQVAQKGYGQGQSERDQPHATQWCEPGQWAVELAVAGVQPRETGEEPAAEGFLGDP